jgi:deazaflavin-dependent oxidoreductase (nitroreductase family)
MRLLDRWAEGMQGKVKERPDGLDSPVVPKVMKRVGWAHVWVYRRTGGRIGGRWRIGSALLRPVPTLLLDHVGRRSGATYTTPLLYLADGPDVVVVASQGGLPKDPQWYRNLLAHPDTQVQIGPEVRRVRARTATPEERAALWPRLVELYSDFANYERWTEREIPVVVCEPR